MKRLLLLLLVLLAAPLAAQEPGDEPWNEQYDPRSFTCPLGGERFDQDVGYASFPLETLPDGSWLGDIAIGAQIPQCPGNGLVILPDYAASDEAGAMAYSDYSAAELARLPALITDPRYAALKADGRFAQAYWLATQLGRPPLERFTLLQRATWGALAPELRRRLVETFVAEAPTLIAASDLPDAAKRFQTSYVVNGLRELGRFDEALALLDELEQGEAALFEAADPDDLFAGELGPKMRLAIGQRDDGRFPIELLGSRVVGLICGGEAVAPYDQRTSANIAACDTRREREAAESTAFESALDESFALREDLPALEQRCSETAPEDRSEGLEFACEAVQRARDQRAAAELVKDGAALAARCTSIPEIDLEGALFYACLSFETALESALADAIGGDEVAWQVFCPEGDSEAEVEDRNLHVSLACRRAATQRREMAEEALLADPAALDTRCPAASSDEDFDIVLYGACSKLAERRRTASIDLRASDPAQFERACASFGATNAAGNDVYDLTDEQETCRSAWRLRENRAARSRAEAAGLKCFHDVIYSPERPRCVSPDEYEREMAVGRGGFFDPVQDDRFDEGSSLRQAAREHAAQIVAAGKAARTYPKRKRGDRY